METLETLKLKDTVARLQENMMAAETVHQLTAIILDYTHEEMMVAYQQLPQEAQLQIHRIWEWEQGSRGEEERGRGGD